MPPHIATSMLDRLILRDDQMLLPEQMILVSSGQLYGDFCSDIRLRVFAPGLDEVKLRAALAGSLRRLIDDQLDRVSSVTMDDEVIVLAPLAAEDVPAAIGELLGRIPALLKPWVQGRQIYTLRGGERLVVVDYERISFGVRLYFPATIQLAGYETDRSQLEIFLAQSLQAFPVATYVNLGQGEVTVHLALARHSLSERDFARMLERLIAALASQVVERRYWLKFVLGQPKANPGNGGGLGRSS